MKDRKDEPEIARALSLTRPWPYCILHLGKRIENRGREDGKEPKALTRYRGVLYLHAAKSWAPSVASTVRGLGFDDVIYDSLRDKLQHPAGAIVGKCRVVGHVGPSRHGPDGIPDYFLDDIDGDALDLRWWQGGYALVLDDVVAFKEPIPCTGRLNIWKIPDVVRKRVLSVERRMKTKYKCRTCGRVTAGRRGPGDRPKHYPRRHRRFGGTTCPGTFMEAIVTPP